jgi:DNA-binding CsgD family transcriptional regulator
MALYISIRAIGFSGWARIMEQKVFSELVGAIYDCAIDATRWPDLLERLRGQFDLAVVQIALHRVPDMLPLINHVGGLSDDEIAKMERLSPYAPEIWGGLEASMTRPIDRPWVASQISTRQQWQSMVYYREWARPRRLADSAVVILARDATLLGSFGLATHERRGLVDEALVADLTALLPHFQRSAHISGMLDAHVVAARQFEALIETLVAPVIMVGAALQVVHANASARRMFDQGDLLGHSRGSLTSDIPGVRQALLRIIAKLVESETLTPGSGIGLPVRTRNGAVHTLHVMPLAHGDLRPGLVVGARAAVFVSSVPTSHNLAHDVLQSLFMLTPAEVRVFDLIANGATTRETAERLDVAVSTVRTHLIRIFAKTGVNRQADLIRMAASLTSPTIAEQTRQLSR